ncbi:MAG: sensor histidine kinase, partial [Alphaproteobacteria bacterium]
IMDAFMVLPRRDNRLILVKGMARHAAGDFIEVIIDEAPLRMAMIDYATNILALSLVISIFTVGLVYRTLHRLLVGPMRRITGAMVAFRDDPLSGDNMIAAKGRADEIGQAEQALADMQADVRDALRQKEHLAALGGAVSKINHDMRNILTSVQMLSDTIVESDDPQVQRLGPKLVAALDRAVRLTENVLKFGSSQEAPPSLTHLGLHALVDDVIATACPTTGGEVDKGRVQVENNVPRNLVVVADADQLFRILLNLVRNAVQAFADSGKAGKVCIDAGADVDAVQICVMDNGPGLPQKAQDHLFAPFQGSSSRGGTGLGLAIAQELARGHGGEITLDYTGKTGTQFSIRLPKGVVG